MRRVGVRLALAVLVAATGLGWASAPASAEYNCVVQGHLTLLEPFELPFVSNKQTTFSFRADNQPCVFAPVPIFLDISGSGTITGACGEATGSGSMHVGGETANFVFTETANAFVIIGSSLLVAEGTLIPDPLTGESCLSGADNFVLVMHVLTI